MMGNGGEGCCRPEPPQEDRQGEQEDGESLVIRRNHAALGREWQGWVAAGAPVSAQQPTHRTVPLSSTFISPQALCSG